MKRKIVIELNYSDNLFPTSCDGCEWYDDMDCQLFNEEVGDDDDVTQRCDECLAAEKEYQDLIAAGR
jgi:hypothetical protein